MKEYHLTKVQEQFLILQKIYTANTAYNIPSVFRINGIPDVDRLNFALKKIAGRHKILLAEIAENSTPATMVIDENQDSPKVEVIKVTLPGNDSLPKEVTDEIHHPFDLTKGPLFRAKLFVCSETLSFLAFTFHHIIVDLRTKEIFASELQQLYNLSVPNEDVTLPEFSDYSDYASWQKEWLSSEEAQKQLANWKHELGEPSEPLSLPADFDRPKNLSPVFGERLNFVLAAGLSDQVKEFAKKYSVSPFVVLLGAYSIFLSRLSGQNEVTIGVPMTNRRQEGSDYCFGCFMNSLPVKVSVGENETGETIIRQIRQKMMFVHRNQELPFLTLASLPELKKTSGSSPIYQAGFTFEPPMELHLDGFETETVLLERKGAQLEMFLLFFERNNLFHGTFEYSTELFSRETIARWKEIYTTTLVSMMEQPTAPVDEMNILPEKEWLELKSWNETDAAYESYLCIHQKFEKTAAEFPDFPALNYYGKTLTYSELNTQINRLAHFLIDNGTQVGDKIGICINRSIEMVVAIYATLKAGAAYVPIEPEAPAERIKTVTDSADLKFILTSAATAKNLEKSSKNIFLDPILTENISEKTRNPNIEISSRNLAYILFTSGSTGKPKGVMIEHHSVMNKIGWMQKKFPLSPGESMLQKTPITFDVSVWEIIWWMFAGGSLNLLKPGGEKDPAAMAERIRDQKPAVLIFVPSVFSLFLDYLSATHQESSLSGIRWIVLIGEALTPALANRFHKMYETIPDPELINTYGPTEATVAVSWYGCPPSSDTKKVFIGKPIDNTKLLIVNRKHKIQPIGVPGELMITGVNLARGYLGDSDLTNQKFVELALPDGQKTRAYKTGDLALWHTLGEIDFIGRTDNQIKIHGIRVELGDIETKILEYPDVSEAAVILCAQASGNKFLAGYVVLKDGKVGKSNEISTWLKNKLPLYMIPATFTELAKMPLTTSGKINRKALPTPVFATEKNFSPPVSEYEKKLAEIWKEVLNINKVGIDDNFFELGGDSMLAVALSTRIQQQLASQIDVLKIMEYPNIKTFSEYLAGFKKPKDETITAEDRAALRRMNARRRE